MSVLVFDIETVPDVTSARRLHGFDNLQDKDVSLAMNALQRQKNGSEFLPHYLQKIVAISLVLEKQDAVKVWSLGNESSNEAELIERFFHGIEKYTPTLVSWNGSGFDLPVLHYRALMHGVRAPKYWDNGEHDQSFKWNNYLSRFHYRHLDLMDVLAGYQNKAYAPLDDIAVLSGFPGKMGMSGSKVWDYYQTGDLKSIRDYCETDVLNTYGVYLRFQHMRGMLDDVQYDQKIENLEQYLVHETERAHLQEFLQKWQET